MPCIAFEVSSAWSRAQPFSHTKCTRAQAPTWCDVDFDSRRRFALATVPAGALLFDPIDEQPPLHERCLGEWPHAVSAVGELAVAPMLRQPDE